MLATAAAALPIAAQGQVVYTDLSGNPNSATASANAYGASDFTVTFDQNNANSSFEFFADVEPYQCSTTCSPAYGKAYVLPNSGTWVGNPTPVSAGAYIDANSTYGSGTGTLAKNSEYTPANTQNWPSDGSYAYLGVSFTDPNAPTGSAPYYGWISVSATAVDINDATVAVNGFAYNATAGNCIAAGQTTGDCTEISATPEPSSLALLALGAVGLTAIRRRRARA